MPSAHGIEEVKRFILGERALLLPEAGMGCAVGTRGDDEIMRNGRAWDRAKLIETLITSCVACEEPS